MIGIPTADFARRADFYDHLAILQKPVGTIQTSTHGQSPARNRNIIIQQALENDCTHILFIDDDVLPPTDGLLRLLEHDVDMVTGLYVMRPYPHKPILFDLQNEEGLVRWMQLTPDKNGFIPAVSGGLGFCLIKTDVFRAMEKPWVRLGEIESDKDHWCDDIGFFKRAREAGFELFADLTVCCGHICSMVLRPVCINGTWYTTYDTSGEKSVTIPQFYVGDVHGTN